MSRSWTHRIKDRLNDRAFVPRDTDRDALSKLLDEQFPLSPPAQTTKSSWPRGAWVGGLSALLMLIVPSDGLQITENSIDQRFKTEDALNRAVESISADVLTGALNQTQTAAPENAETEIAEAAREPNAFLPELKMNRAGEQRRARSGQASAGASELRLSEPRISEKRLSEQAVDRSLGSVASEGNARSASESVNRPLATGSNAAHEPLEGGVQESAPSPYRGAQKTIPAAPANEASRTALGATPELLFPSDKIAARSLLLPLPEQNRAIQQPSDWNLKRKPHRSWAPDGFGLSSGPGVSKGWEAQGLIHWQRSGFRWGTGMGTGQTGAAQRHSEAYSYWDTETRQEWQITTQYLAQIDSTWRILGINQGGWEIDTTYIPVVDSNWVSVLDSTERFGMLEKTRLRSAQLIEIPVFAERVWSRGRWEFSGGLGFGFGLLRIDADPEFGFAAEDVFRSSIELRMGADWRWNEHGSLGIGWTPRQIWYASPDFDPVADLRALRLRMSWRW